MRPMTFRLENIPAGTTAEALKHQFSIDDQAYEYLEVRSLVPAVDNIDGEGDLTATVTFQALSPIFQSPRMLSDQLGLDCDFHGFTPLYQPEGHIAADIIAVTGLAAHPFGSWAHSPQNMWLRDYLPRDTRNARILIYGYPSQLYQSMSRSILSDFCNNFIQRLLSMRDMGRCSKRPIIFIGHSLGCLIIKKALIDINGTIGIHRSPLPVELIIFLGAPHRGLHTAALETLTRSRPTEDMIRELRSQSPTLTDLNNKFRYVARDIEILTCYEQNPTRTAIEMSDGSWKREGPHEMMVSLDSAQLFYPHETLISSNTDHSEIAKLKRGEASIYPHIKWAINLALRNLVEQGPIPSGAQITSKLNQDRSVVDTPMEAVDLELASSNKTVQRQETDIHSVSRTVKKTILEPEMLQAIRDGNAELVRRLVRDEYDINCRSHSGGFTILHRAALYRQEAVITLAFELKVDPLIKDIIGWTALHYVSLPFHGQNPITKSIMEGLLRNNSEVDAVDEYKRTPLMVAAGYGEVVAAESLIAHGANVHTANNLNHGQHVLHVAAIRGRANMIRLLVAHGARLEVKDGSSAQDTPLLSLMRVSPVTDNHVKCLEELLELGADIEAQTEDGFRPLHLAVHFGLPLYVGMLLRYGANPCARVPGPSRSVKFDSAGSYKPSNVLVGGVVVPETRALQHELTSRLRAAEREWEERHPRSTNNTTGHQTTV